MQELNSVTSGSGNIKAKKPLEPNGAIPKADIVETDSKYVLFVDMPGLASSEIEISVEGGVLILEGVSRAPFSRAYFRQFKLPDSVDVGDISAKFSHGILEVDFPKNADSKRKLIPLSQH